VRRWDVLNGFNGFNAFNAFNLFNALDGALSSIDSSAGLQRVIRDS